VVRCLVHSKKLIKRNQVSTITHYPSISFRDAQQKVRKSIRNISKTQGVSSSEFFRDLLS